MKLEEVLPYLRKRCVIRLGGSISLDIDSNIDVFMKKLSVKHILSDEWEVKGLIQFSKLKGENKT